MRRLAAVDIGSNTVHALVAEELDGRLRDLAFYLETPALGEVVDRTGRIGSAAGRVLDALERVLAEAQTLEPEAVVLGATAAVRKAEDGHEFLERAGRLIGTPVRLISEQREAELSFAGVASRHAGRGAWLMGDLGGGSTEIVVAEAERMLRWVSLPLGSGTLASRHLSDPPSTVERALLRAAALPLVVRAPEADVQKMVLTGGTAAYLPLFVSRRSPPTILTTAALLTAAERLDSAPAARLAVASGLPEARVGSLRAGAEIVLLLLDFYGLEKVHVSHEGLRHGMLLAWLHLGEDWWRTPGASSTPTYH